MITSGARIFGAAQISSSGDLFPEENGARAAPLEKGRDRCAGLQNSVPSITADFVLRYWISCEIKVPYSNLVSQRHIDKESRLWNSEQVKPDARKIDKHSLKNRRRELNIAFQT